VPRPVLQSTSPLFDEYRGTISPEISGKLQDKCLTLKNGEEKAAVALRNYSNILKKDNRKMTNILRHDV
jgi:hypothetical protein